MPSAKVKNISLDVLVLPKVHNLSVSVSIPFGCSPEYLALLMTNNPCESTKECQQPMYKGLEESAIAFALFKLVQEKLCGSPLEVARTKVDHVCCNVHGDMFVISFNTQSTGSALRKTIGVVLKCLAPNTLFSRYSHFVKLLGGKASRPEFNYVANQMITGLTKNIHFVVVGKIKADADFKTILEVASKKYVSSTKSNAGESKIAEKRSEHKTDWPILNCTNGSNSIVINDYISHSGFGTRLCGNKITIFSNQWASKRDMLKKKDRINGYISTKYDKLESPNLFLAYVANGNCLGSGNSILGLKSIKPAEVILKNI